MLLKLSYQNKNVQKVLKRKKKEKFKQNTYICIKKYEFDYFFQYKITV